MKATAVSTFAERAIQFYGDEDTVYEKIRAVEKQRAGNNADSNYHVDSGGDATVAQSTETDTRAAETGDSQNEMKQTR